jgi:hypothetical protein
VVVEVKGHKGHKGLAVERQLSLIQNRFEGVVVVLRILNRKVHDVLVVPHLALISHRRELALHLELI